MSIKTNETQIVVQTEKLCINDFSLKKNIKFTQELTRAKNNGQIQIRGDKEKKATKLVYCINTLERHINQKPVTFR